MKRFSDRSGMTMIELVSALMLFIFILGALIMALNKATTLWSSTHTHQYSQDKANLILSMMASDLQHAVTDNGLPLESSTQTPSTFYCDSTTNNNAGVQMLLQFIKHRTKPSPFDDTPDAAPALDAVFYTFVQDSIFRHVIPLKYSDPNDPEHIGKLLEDLRPDVDNASLHTEILNYLDDPLGTAEPNVPWEYSLLSGKVTHPVILAGIPSIYVRDNKSNLVSTPAKDATLQSLPEYNKVETAVLPNYIDISLRIFNDAEWIKYILLFDESIDDQTFARKERSLGSYSSRRISFRTTRGARLP